MTIQQAIEKAIEVGYDYNEEIPPYTDRLSTLLLDPLFWSSLGKAMGWEEWLPTGYYDKLEGDIKDKGWLVHWHRFVGHLADGGTPESFFANLSH